MLRLILFVCLFWCTQAQSHPVLKDIDSIIQDALQQSQVPGMALGVIVEDRIILARGYGLRDLEAKLPVTEETLFPIASSTKAFTAHLLAQLVDEGKISWEDPVIRYLPEFRLYDQRTEQVTIRDILAHRTGIPRHDALWVCQDLAKSDILSRLPYLQPMADLRKQFEYSNMMYAVAGMVFERVAHQTWEEALAERIFMPLKMKSAGANVAQPYVSFDGVVEAVPFYNFDAVKPGSGIQASVLDMLKWMQEQLQGRLVSPQSLQEMHSAQISFPPKYEHPDIFKEGYGLGWFVGRYRGHRMLNHEGHRPGFFSDVALLPELKIGIVLLCNSGNDGRFVISSIRNMLLDHLIGASGTDWMEIMLKNRNAYKQQLQEAKEKDQVVASASFADYEGSYFHPAYGLAIVSGDVCTYGRTNIHLQSKGGDRLRGHFLALRHYGVYPAIPITFVRNTDGQIVEMHVGFESFRQAPSVVFTRMEMMNVVPSSPAIPAELNTFLTEFCKDPWNCDKQRKSLQRRV